MRKLDERTQVKETIEAMKMRLQVIGATPVLADVQKKLMAVTQLDPETATAKDISDIMGNHQWVYPRMCEECSTRTWDIIAMTDNENPLHKNVVYKSFLCEKCLMAALELVRK